MAGPREGKSLLQKSRTLSGHSYPCAIEVQGPHSEAARIGQALEVRRVALGDSLILRNNRSLFLVQCPTL